jgi:hypothetical protein
MAEGDGRRRALLALGVRLARAGVGSKVGLAAGAVITFGAVALAFVLGRRGAAVQLGELPSGVAALLAWVPGLLVAVTAAAQALRHDRDLGVRALAARAGATPRGYLVARTMGLVLLLVALIVGGTLLTGAACTALAGRRALLYVAQGSAAALVYAAAFAVTLGVVAMAALGARSRAGGFAWLLGVLLLPELFARWTEDILPDAWHDFTSIPGALGALRVALMPPGADAARLARAAVVLGAVVVVSLVVVRAQLARVDREGAAR